MRDEGAEKVQRFSSGGLVTGVLGLAVVAAVLLYGVLGAEDDYAPWAWPALLLVAVGIWAVLVRPCVVMRADTIELREPLHSWWIPFARVTGVEVTLVTRVRTAERDYVGNGLSRSRRRIRRDKQLGADARPEEHSLAALVEQRLSARATRAREDQPAGQEPPAVRRAWAWPEIVAIAVLAVATVVLAVA